MNSEKLLIQQKQEKNTVDPTFYVYFDEWHGKIISISNKKQNKLEYPFLKTKDLIARDLMTGKKSIKRYVVADDFGKNYKIVLRDNYLRLKKAEEYLSKIKETAFSTEQDINIISYLTDYKLEINLSEDLFYKITGSKTNTEIHIENEHEFEDLYFYITKKNNPNILYKTLNVNPVDLVKNHRKLFDLADLRTLAKLKDIDIYTKRVFKTYGLKTKHNFIESDSRKVKKRTHTYIYPKHFEDNTTFTVSPSTQGWIIRSNFENPHEYKIYNDLHLFLTGNNPNQLLDKIVVPLDKMGNYQECIVQTQVDPTICKILVGEQGKNINFKFEEI